MYICLPVYGLFMTFGTRLRCPQWSVKDEFKFRGVYIYICMCNFPSFLDGTLGPHKVSPSDTAFGEYFDFFPCFALMSNLFEDCSASCCSGSGSWGFHSRAAFAMSPGGRRSVWPNHPHFLCWISDSIGLCLALAHSSWFDVWTSQSIFSILRMHLLRGVCKSRYIYVTFGILSIMLCVTYTVCGAKGFEVLWVCQA